MNFFRTLLKKHPVKEIDCLTEFSADDLVDMFWALRVLPQHPGVPFLNRMVATFFRKLRDLKGSQIAQIIYTFGVFKHALGQEFFDLCFQCLNFGNFGIADYAAMGWGLHLLGILTFLRLSEI